MEDQENNQERKQPIEAKKTENSSYKNSGSSFRTVTASTYQGKEKKSSGFGKTVLLPFCCGMLGTAVVLGVAFGVPSFRNNLIDGTTPQTGSYTNQSNSTPNATHISLTDYSNTATGVAEKVRPSIVGIKVEYSTTSIFYQGSGTATAEGSGIIISQDGYILTNNHVVNSTTSTSSFSELGKANKITVYLYNDETAYDAKIIGTDEQTDLAVIKIEKNNLTAAELGDSDSVKVGEFSMAVGNPLGMQSSVTSGIISALNRKVTDTDGKSYTLIQTDAAINSGNSGGALVNSEGKVIGINTLKMSGNGVEGLGFAIPINSAKPIYEQLIQYNKVKRPYIGISGKDLSESVAKANNLVVGVYVVSVEDFSAGQKADIRIGDVIIEVDGQKITTMDELNEIKNKHNIGDTMTLKVYRDGKEKELKVTLAEQ